LPIEFGFSLASSASCCARLASAIWRLGLTGCTLDFEEGRPGGDLLAVLVADLVQKTLHPRHQIDLVERGRVAREFKV
jgi:hypothetical protein